MSSIFTRLIITSNAHIAKSLDLVPEVIPLKHPSSLCRFLSKIVDILATRKQSQSDLVGCEEIDKHPTKACKFLRFITK